jgi:hypothetical protein
MLAGSNFRLSVALTVTAASGDGVEHAPADVLDEGIFTAPPVSEPLHATPAAASATTAPTIPKRLTIVLT